jgi:hypothetical protein
MTKELIIPDEFPPLPRYRWKTRPDSVPLTDPEVKTALMLSSGNLVKAAEKLRTTIIILQLYIKKSKPAQALMDELLQINVLKAEGEPIRALFDPASSDRRREWAASLILRSELGASDPFAPAPSAHTSVNVAISAKTLIVRWADETIIAKTNPIAAAPTQTDCSAPHTTTESPPSPIPCLGPSRSPTPQSPPHSPEPQSPPSPHAPPQEVSASPTSDDADQTPKSQAPAPPPEDGPDAS